MKILEINSFNFGSTGTIMNSIAHTAEKMGHIVTVSCPKSRENAKRERENQIFIGNRVSRNLHMFFAKFFGLHGCFSFFSTMRFIRKIKKFSPDIIHLHNLHENYINIPMLFKYIKKKGIRVVWTLHDCWAFTGHCPYFDMVNCHKWKIWCYECPQYKDYPPSFFDDSKKMYALKKKWFTGIGSMTIVTPSKWLANLVEQSFLKNNTIQVINNGIDLFVFKPTHSTFREDNNIASNDYLLLGVAFGWGRRKGLDAFIALSKRLPNNFKIVLVGTDEDIDKQLPENIISVHRTRNQTELAKIFSAADLFINPTREDNFPTTNLEALACGTPVLTYNTGGSIESINEDCGAIVAKDDIDSLEKEIIKIAADKLFSKEACLKQAIKFNMNDRFQEYVELFQKIVNDTK